MLEHSEKLMDHFLNPRNVGIIEKPDGYSRIENPINGDITELFIRINDYEITDTSFQTCGCVVAIASSSALSEIIKGYSLEYIIKKNTELIEELIVSIENKLDKTPEKNWHCPYISIKAFLTAVKNYYQKNQDNDKVDIVEKMLSFLQHEFNKKLKKYKA